MSGGGGGAQMPMASNQGQMMGGMFGGMQPQMGSMPMQNNQPYAMPGQQMGGGQGSTPRFANQQAYDQYMAQGGGGMQPAMGGGIAALGGQAIQRGFGDDAGMGIPKYAPPPYMEGQMPMKGAMGAPMDYGTPRFPPPGVIPEMNPYQQNPNQVDMRPTNMGPGNGFAPRGSDGVGDGTGPGGMGFGPKPFLPGRGMPPAYGPTKGPIDGRHLRDMMDIYRRRPMGNMGGEDDRGQNRLPGAIGNDLPPSLKRPTQGDYKNFK